MYVLLGAELFVDSNGVEETLTSTRNFAPGLWDPEGP